MNHMAGLNQKYGENGIGSTKNSYFNAYDHQESFPSVPYYAADFHDSICDHDIDNWGNPWDVRYSKFR